MGPSYKTKLKQKRGIGYGKDYIPWIKVGEFSSKGHSSRILGLKSGREHHFHSNFEASLFYVLDLNDDVEDIREQYPLLDINLARSIAEQAGIIYPSNVDHILTSDYRITYSNGYDVILTLKPLAEINKRQLELFEIERQYWLRKEIEWKIVTEREMPSKECLLNYKDLHNALRGFLFDNHSEELIQQIYYHIIEIYSELSEYSLPKFSLKIDGDLNINEGTTLRLIKTLIAKGFIETDLNQSLIKGKKRIKDLKLEF